MVPFSSEKIESLKTTKILKGITLVFYSLELVAFLLLAIVALPFVLKNTSSDFALMQQFLEIAFLFPIIIALIGKYYCFTAPKEMDGQIPIFIAVVCSALQLGITLFNEMLLLHPVWYEISNIFGGFSYLFFLVFLKKLATFLQKKEWFLPITLLFIFILFFIFLHILLLLPRFGGTGLIQSFFLLLPPPLLENLPMGILVSFALTLLMYSNLLYQIKDALQLSSNISPE